MLSGLLGCDTAPALLGPALGGRFGTEAVCITRGAHGAALWAGGRSSEVDGIPVDVVDAVGAGDAFAAGLLHGMLVGQAPPDALRFANRLGALVASRAGALPPWSPDEIG